ncbi:MAG TPA: hypothetical protein VGG69_03620 [Rhizomicrobium sp.]
MEIKEGEVLLEFLFLGNSVKVTAIDGATGQEASIVGPASAARKNLEAAAVRKLRYVLNRRKPG